MQIFHTHTFSSELRHLPIRVKKIYKQQESLFVINWRDPRLHTKKLRGNQDIFSFRVTRRYRALFILVDPESAIFTSIGHRKSIYD